MTLNRTPGVRLEDTAGDDYQIIADGNNFTIGEIGVAAPRLTIDTAGRVGIGTDTPGSLLDVNGRADLTDRLSLRQAGFDPVNNNMSVDITHDGSQLLFRMSGAGGRVPINFSMQDDSALFIDGNRNVGIGLRPNVQPAGRLDVRSPTDWYLLALGVDNNRDTYLRADNPANGNVIIGDTQTVMTVIQPISGNVGIGTYNPTARLHVRQSGNDRDNGLYIQRRSSDYGAVMYMDPDGGVRIGTKSDSGTDYNADYIYLATGSGNVGIGTPSPGAKLEVAGQIKITGGAPGEGKVLTSDGAGLGTWLPIPPALQEDDPQVDNNLQHNAVPRWDVTVQPPRLVTGSIFNTPNGNVGIGTANPSEKLDIQGGRLRIGNTMIHDNEINRYMNDNLYIGYRTTANTILQLNAGNVGIGTPSPTAKLDVNGHAMVRGALGLDWADNRIQAFPSTPDPGYNHKPFLALSARAPAYDNRLITTLVPHYEGLYVAEWRNRWPNIHVKEDGRLYVRRYVEEGSDSRTKFDQKPLDYGLDKVMALHPTRYKQAEWEHDKETGKIIIHPEKARNDIGLVAQQLHKIIPEAVDVPEDEAKQPWSIAYSKLIPVLINAIQEQQKQIEKLEDKIERLEKKIRDK